MIKGYDITTHNAEAVAHVINSLGVGIPMALTLRELVVNGIEACLRNNSEEEKVVYICKDHVYPNKLAVINIGGDFLSEKTMKENLATIGNSGNMGMKSGKVILDKNKGIGAKVAYLPNASCGLVYRSIKAYEDLGIMAQMRKDKDRAVYTLPPFECPVTSEITAFPMYGNFTEYGKPKNTITEVVCMGDHESVDTWHEFDFKCGKRKGQGDGGTGYGNFRYLTHRLWLEPEVETKVAIYYKKTGAFKAWKRVSGLKDFMENMTQINGVVDVSVNGLAAKAHWCVLSSAGEAKYSSNWAASGKTAFAWKGETYSDFTQHILSKKKDLNQSGIIVNYDKVMIIFEFDSSVQLKTNPGRTQLYYKNPTINEDQLIDKALFHEQFRLNMPKELKDWQEENQSKSEDDKDIKKYIKNMLKQYHFGSKKSNLNNNVPPVNIPPVSKNNNKNKSGKKNQTSRSGNPPSTAPKQITYISKLKTMRPPDITFLDEPNAPLVELHCNGSQFELCVNIGSSVFAHRLEKTEKAFGSPCLVRDYIKHLVKQEISAAAVLRVFDIYVSHSNLSLEEKKTFWEPKCLESCWSRQTESEILKKAKSKNKQAILLNSNIDIAAAK